METGQILLVDFGAADFMERAKLKDFQGLYIFYCKSLQRKT